MIVHRSGSGLWPAKPIAFECLVSAAVLAELTRRKCKLLWIPRSDCRCYFTDLFRSPPWLRVVPRWRIVVERRRLLAPLRTARLVITQDSLRDMKYVVNITTLDRHSFIYFDGCYSDFMPPDLSPEDYAAKVSWYLKALVPS
jgi:hypothetical protein